MNLWNQEHTMNNAAAEYTARFAPYLAYLDCAYFFTASDVATLDQVVVETCTLDDAVDAYRRYEMSGYAMSPAILPLENGSDLVLDLRKAPGYKDLSGLDVAA